MPRAWVAALLGCALLLALLTGDSPTPALGVCVLLGVAAWLTWFPSPRRLLLAGLFFTAPIDVSKAIVAPLDRFYSPGLYLTLAHVMLLGLAAVWLVQRLLIERRGLPFTRTDALAAAFLGIVVLRTVGSLQGDLAWASVVAYGLSVLAYWVASHAIEDMDDLRLALRAAGAAVACEALYVAAQVATHSALPLPGSKAITLGETLYFGGAGAAFRPNGFLSHPNALADHMTLVLPPLLALLLLGRRLPGRVRAVAGVLAVLGTGMLLVTLSRGGWMAALLGAGWVLWHFTRRGILGPVQLRRLAALAVLGLVLVVSVYPQLLLRLTAPDDRSTESRVILADQALTIIGKHPLLGVGFGGYNRAAYEIIAPSFARISTEYQEALLQLVVHNHYLLVGAELGLPALALFLVLLATWVRLPLPMARWPEPGAFALATGLSGALLTQVLFLASDNFYADVRVFLIWLTAGLLQALSLMQQRLGAPALMAAPPLAARGGRP